MTNPALIADIVAITRSLDPKAPVYPTALPELLLLHDTAPTRLQGSVYEPVICLVLQGRKETRIGDRVVRFGPGDALIVSHSLPVMAAVTEASPEKPYVAMVLRLDLSLARRLEQEAEIPVPAGEPAESLAAAPTPPALIDALARLLRASADPVEAAVLAPLIVREIHFRLLQADHGGMLRQLLRRDSPASRVEKAIAKIRADLSQPVSVPEMAEISGMSVSAFHAHFKSVTATSPLQYQKDLRLMEARRRLTTEGGPVSTVAFDVGYESPTQFSREYARKFGVPPRADKAELRAAG